MAKANITAKYVREALDYDPETGIFTWKVRPREHFEKKSIWLMWNTQRAGKQAGCVDPEGYRIVKLGNRTYRSHRLAFLIMTGKFPSDMTDHINGIRDDNRWCNLRPVNHKENCYNMKLFVTSTSGQSGVNWHSRQKKWLARINHNGERVHLGCYDTKENAAPARRLAEIRFGYHPNHGR